MYNIVVRHLCNLQNDHPESLVPAWHHISYYNVTDCFPYAALYVTWLFCNCQFVLLNPFTILTQPPDLPPIWQPRVYSLYM